MRKFKIANKEIFPDSIEGKRDILLLSKLIQRMFDGEEPAGNSNRMI